MPLGAPSLPPRTALAKEAADCCSLQVLLGVTVGTRTAEIRATSYIQVDHPTNTSISIVTKAGEQEQLKPN